MWTIFGVVYLVLNSTLLQVVGSKEYESPQECLAAAMEIMQNKEEPHHMSCVPVFRPIEGT